jgi:hypothetical protein
VSACLKHISMWRVRAGETATKAQTVAVLQEAVQQMRGRIPGLRAIELGIDIGGPSERSDVVLYTEFDALSDLAVYLEHEDHLKLVALLSSCRVETRVVDYFSEP